MPAYLPHQQIAFSALQCAVSVRRVVLSALLYVIVANHSDYERPGQSTLNGLLARVALTNCFLLARVTLCCKLH